MMGVCVESLPLTGERTVPDIPAERYWYFRHEAVYRWLLDEVLSDLRGTGADPWLLDAGCGEGYGAQLLAPAVVGVVALDFDATTIAHVATAYPALSAVRGNLVGLPFATGVFAATVSLQVIEHIWDLAGFLQECHRVVRPGGIIAVSTPNRPVFSPGLARGAKPTNPFHVEEFDAEQVAALVSAAGFREVALAGLHHGPRIADWEQTHGPIVAAHINEVHRGAPDPELQDFVAGLTVLDFEIGAAEGCHDLIGWGRR